MNDSNQRELLRVSYPTTLIHGPQFHPVDDTIEIDLTYRCNLKCIGCNRSCRQAPDDIDISTTQVLKFIDESKHDNRKWKRIRILGGEPTLHPDIGWVMEELAKYQANYLPNMMLELVTNGHGDYVRKKLTNLPSCVIITNTHKESPIGNRFENFNNAPKDDLRFTFTDYSNGCWIMQECGLGMTPYGFYQCAIAGGIDRVIGYDIGLKHIPFLKDDNRSLKRQMRALCRWCGHFQTRNKIHTSERQEIIESNYSYSWENAYLLFHNQKPELSQY